MGSPSRRSSETVCEMHDDQIENVIKMGAEYSDKGDLRFATTLLCHTVFADQSNQYTSKALGTVTTKLGYGPDNATWRNVYLTGAK
jgi:alkyl sulfatase BDS1-like metallo-beta-lactamase superfamily hydrolase